MATKTKSKTTPESYRNTGQPWTEAHVRQLRQLARENTPTRVIGLKLGRTPRAIQSKASEEGISLMPPNRSPSSRTKGSSAGRSGRASKSSGFGRAGRSSGAGRGQARRAAKTTGARRSR